MPGKNKYTLGKRRDDGVDLTVPSGSLCRVRRPGVQGLMKIGVLDSLDQLTSWVAMGPLQPDKPQGGLSAEQILDLASRKDDLEAGLALVDKVVEYVVLQPRLLRPIRRDEHTREPILTEDGKEIPLPEADRDPEQIYTDDVDMEDRMFILQFCVGGSSDLERFRKEWEGSMGSLAALQDVPQDAQ